MHGLIIFIILGMLAAAVSAIVTLIEKVIDYRAEVLYWRKARRYHTFMTQWYIRRKRFGNRFI